MIRLGSESLEHNWVTAIVIPRCYQSIAIVTKTVKYNNLELVTFCDQLKPWASSYTRVVPNTRLTGLLFLRAFQWSCKITTEIMVPPRPTFVHQASRPDPWLVCSLSLWKLLCHWHQTNTATFSSSQSHGISFQVVKILYMHDNLDNFLNLLLHFIIIMWFLHAIHSHKFQG